jgi:hypothetical protein
LSGATSNHDKAILSRKFFSYTYHNLLSGKQEQVNLLKVQDRHSVAQQGVRFALRQEPEPLVPHRAPQATQAKNAVPAERSRKNALRQALWGEGCGAGKRVSI